MKNNYPDIQLSNCKEEWKLCKLGNLASIVRGSSPRPIQDPKWFDSSSEVGWLRISDVSYQNGRITYLEQKLSLEGQQKTRVLLEPHLLLSIAATVGKPVINYVKTGVHDGFLIFNNPTFDKEFMFQWLEMHRPKWQKFGQPGSQVNLNSELVQNQEIFIPELNEQRRIGSFLKKIEDTITFHQQELDALKQTKQGFLQKMFPKQGESEPQLRFSGFKEKWNEKKLIEIVDFFNNNRIPIEAENRIKGNYAYYGASGIIDYVENYIFDGEYVLLAEDGANIITRSSPIAYITQGKFWVNNHAHVMRMKTGSNFFLLQQLERQNYKKFNSGTAQPKLNAKIVHNINISIPTENEQIKIGEFFKQLDEVIDLKEQELEVLKKTKQGFLQKMFV